MLATALTTMALAASAQEPPKYAEATSYCLRGTMADGSFTRPRSVAMNSLPLGSLIKLERPRSFRGLRYFLVRDRIGWGTQLDFWNPSCWHARAWGRHTVKYRVLRYGH